MADQHFPGRNDCIRHACLSAGFTPRFASFADSLTALAGMVAGGMGVAVAPATIASCPLQGVHLIPVRKPRVAAESVAAWRKGRRVEPGVEMFVQMLEESAAAPMQPARRRRGA